MHSAKFSFNENIRASYCVEGSILPAKLAFSSVYFTVWGTTCFDVLVEIFLSFSRR